MPQQRGRGRGRGSDGDWTWNAAGGGGRGGRSRGGRGGRGLRSSGHFDHDDRLQHVKTSDHLKRRPEYTGRGRGKGKGKGKGKSRDFELDGRPLCAVVDRVDEDQLGRHCEVRKAHGAAVTCMAMTAQGIYTGSQDKSLKRWKPTKLTDGRFSLVPELTVPLPDSCFCLLFNGGWFFCGLWSGQIQAFSQDGVELALKGHTRRVTSMLIHQNVLVSGSNDREVRLWQYDPATKTFNCTHTISESMPGSISKLHVLGGNLFVGGMNGIAVVNLETLIVTKLLPPTKPVADMLEFQGHLIVAYTEGSLRIFDTEGNLKSETKPLAAGPVLALAGLDSGPRVLCGHARGQVSTIMLPSFEFKTHFQALDGWKVESILCAGHDGIFLLGAQDGSLQLWQRVAP